MDARIKSTSTRPSILCILFIHVNYPFFVTFVPLWFKY